jgi:hypothetical protein
MICPSVVLCYYATFSYIIVVISILGGHHLHIVDIRLAMQIFTRLIAFIYRHIFKEIPVLRIASLISTICR